MKVEAQYLRIADVVRMPGRGEFEVARLEIGAKVRAWSRTAEPDGDETPRPHAVFESSALVDVQRPGDLFEWPDRLEPSDLLARWVEDLVDADFGGYWCPDLAGLIACAPEGMLGEQAVEYGCIAEHDGGDGVRLRQLHEWTVSNIARWAVVPYAWLDVEQGYHVPQELGEVLVSLDGLELEDDARDALDEILACLWDVLIDPGLIERTMLGDRAEARRLQFEALASIGVWP